MELVCNIPDELYKKWETSKFTLDEAVKFVDCVMNGTPLPEHHGDLVDRNSFEYLKTLNDAIHGKMSWSDAILKIKYSAPTIIPATKEKSCKDCKYQSFREAYSCVETPCNACYEASHFATKEGDEE